jgi:hypothetical protein
MLHQLCTVGYHVGLHSVVLLFVFVFLPLCLGATPMQGIELATVVLGNAMAARVMMIGTMTIQLPQ